MNEETEHEVWMPGYVVLNAEDCEPLSRGTVNSLDVAIAANEAILKMMGGV